MKAPGEGVGAACRLIELTARMQLRKHKFHRGHPFGGVNAGGNTASVVFNRDRAVRVTRKGDLRSVARKDFVACVIEHFLNDVQGVIGEGVHTRPLPDRFKPL